MIIIIVNISEKVMVSDCQYLLIVIWIAANNNYLCH